MASIIENTKDGKIISFKFRVCLGRDENKKQIYCCKTWYPDTTISDNKNRKEAKRQIKIWEEVVKKQRADERKMLMKTPWYLF